MRHKYYLLYFNLNYHTTIVTEVLNLDNRTQSLIERFRRNARFNRVTIDGNFGNEMEELQVIRAALTAKFHNRAEKWMLPRWMILSERDEIGSSTPLLYNNENNSWIVVGGVGSVNYAKMDSAGMISTPHAIGSIDFWFLDDDGLYIPSEHVAEEHIMILSPEDQIYQMNRSHGAVILQRLVYYTENENQEFILNEMLLKNISLEPASFTFFVAVRPFNQLGVLPIERIDFDEDENHLYADDLLALISDTSPNGLIMTTADNPNLIDDVMKDTDRKDSTFSTKRGLATAIMKFEIELQPAERRSLFFATPLSAIESGSNFVKPRLSVEARDRAVLEWFEFSGKRLAGIYPTESITQTLAQAKASLAIQAKSAISRSLEYPTLSNSLDLARTIIAASRCGCSNVLEREQLMKRTLEIEDVESILAIIWVFSEVAKIDLQFSSENKHILEELLRFHTSKVFQVFDAEYGYSDKSVPESHRTDVNIISLEITSIPPSGQFSAYNPLKRKFGFSDLIFLLLISTFTRIAINTATEKSDLDEERLLVVQESSRRLLQDAEKDLLAGDWPRILDSAKKVRQALDLLGLVALLRDDSLDIQNLMSLGIYLEKEHIFRGLFRSSSDLKQVTSYLSLHLAHFFALRGRRDLAEHIFNWVLKHRSSYGFLPETINLETRRGGLGNGCSIKAARDMIILVRDMLMVERGSNLVVAQGIPEEWFTTEVPLMVKGIPSIFGPIGIEFAPSANQHQIELTLEQLPEEIEFSIPSHFPLNMVKAYGGAVIERQEENHLIIMVPFSESVVLAYHRT
ncbi:hypothetical protein EU537_05815 [Candidatus Thorarchaeota archaeon]|nr:MAG: hypothetical protein EU537_05815 [Candidatus Thorarchaeota archaeon]